MSDPAHPLFFFHGKESGPHGSKYQTLSERFGEVHSPDFRGMDLEQRLELAERATRGHSGALLVGSSMGGLVAAIHYHRYPERFLGYVLCAPALNWPPADEIERVPQRAVIIHGRGDDIVPIEASRAFSERWGVELRENDDGHRLAASHDEIVAAVGELSERR